MSFSVWVYEKCVWRVFFFGLTKTIGANQEQEEDDTSLILCTAVNSDESLEEKKKDGAQEVTYMVTRGGRGREEAQSWSWFLFMVCLSMHLSVVFCPQPLLKIHTE